MPLTPIRAFAVLSLCAGAAGLQTPADAATVAVVGGQTSVALDTDALSGAGLTLSGVSDDVIAPGSLPGSVAFAINDRDPAGPGLPTTFTYDPADFLASFAGTIEHQGSVFFNAGALEVGDFTIGFDGSRATGAASGFYVASTTGLSAILFDVGAPSQLDATASLLTIGADLLVSPELAGVLGNDALTGADVGDALVEAAAVPSPAAAGIGLAMLGLAALRRR